jgi:glycosyltransferase involved in cell wall biosynthesis
MPDVDGSLRARPAAEPPTLVMVARFEAPKEHGALLRALSTCLDLPWQLDLVGDGPEMPHVRALVTTLGLGERVRLLGAIGDVASVLSRTQLFVLVTRWEGFPRSVLEAMRAGLPVVASAVGGVHEAIEHGETGLLVPPGDERALSDALRRLLTAPARRARMGELARARYEQRFTFEAMLRGTIAVYDELIAARRV